MTETSSVVDVRTMMTTEVNVAVEIATATREGVERTLERLQRRDLAIDRIEILESERHRPTNVFGRFVRNEA